MEAARTLIGQGESTRPELGRALAARWLGYDPGALARSPQFLLPILHPPPDGTWAQRGKTPSYSPRTGSAARSTPVRFLAALDNVLLAHHDRRRIVTDEQRKLVFWPDSTPWDCSGMSAGRSRS